MKKRALVTGAAGFIASHLCRRLKSEGYYVIGLSRGLWREDRGENPCDEFWTADLQFPPHSECFANLDECYQLACEVGGLGYIMDRANDADCLRNSTLIDLNVLDICRQKKVKRLFFASSGCVYNGGSGVYRESDACPANPLNEFAWQKVFAERLYESYARNYGMEIRIGRLFNTYGPGMPWTGGREKSVAALCRKVAECEEGGTVEVWGDGSQTRDYMHVTDTVEGVRQLMRSDYKDPLNIGSGVGVSIRKLMTLLQRVSRKKFIVEYVDGPTGVRKIMADTQDFVDITGMVLPGLHPEALEEAYRWVEKQVLDTRTKT